MVSDTVTGIQNGGVSVHSLYDLIWQFLIRGSGKTVEETRDMTMAELIASNIIRYRDNVAAPETVGGQDTFFPLLEFPVLDMYASTSQNPEINLLQDGIIASLNSEYASMDNSEGWVDKCTNIFATQDSEYKNSDIVFKLQEFEYKFLDDAIQTNFDSVIPYLVAPRASLTQQEAFELALHQFQIKVYSTSVLGTENLYVDEENTLAVFKHHDLTKFSVEASRAYNTCGNQNTRVHEVQRD